MNIIDEMRLDSGDLILFRGTGWISWFLEWFGVSKYSHVGIVLKNPCYINPNLHEGLYLIDSSFDKIVDAEDGVHKYGVQIHHIDDVLKESAKGSVYYRKINAKRDESFIEKMTEIHKEVHNKPYDLNVYDWILAKYNMNNELPENPKYRVTNKFWCSALIAYIYCKLGWINEDINWSLVAPREFSYDECQHHIKFNSKICNIEKDKLLY
jgi:hypothetical protein